MKFQNCILINFVMNAQTDAGTHGQAESNMPLQLSKDGGIQGVIRKFAEKFY